MRDEAHPTSIPDMTSSQPPKNSPTDPEQASFAARLKQKYGAGVDPEVSLDRATPDAPSGASSELLQRLSDHSLKESRYELQGEIARGGMGAVLRVWDEDLRRTLAMKVILGKGDSPTEGGTPPVDTRMLGRFLEEAQITGQLDHPGIAPVHELGLDSDGRVYFTMKLVKGRDLKHIFDLVFEGKEGWNETRALSVMLKVCEAMAYAHKKGVIHRDLKPANVMVGSFGEVYVMDWGLARVLGRKDTHDIRLRPEFASSLASVKTERRAERDEAPDSPLVTMDGDVMGTPAYMPPEQARGEIEKLSARSDVYALGAMLYHLLARRMPYVPPGAKVNNRMVLLWVLEGPPKRLHELRQEIPAELAAICEKAMSRDAGQRYPDTLALAEDLRAYLEHRVVAAYETGAVAELKKWVGRNKPLAMAIAAAVVLLIGGLVVSSTLYAKADENARVAKLNQDRAVAGEGQALEQSRRADGEAERARLAASESARQEALAKSTLEDVLSLSAIQDLKDLEARADGLWPDEKFGRGLPIGNLTSQWFANLVLGRLDRFVLGEFEASRYLRYMDDFALFADDKLDLQRAHDAIEAFVRDELRLALKIRATILAPVREGLPFLGWRLYPGTMHIRAQNLQRLRRRLRHRAWEQRTGRIEGSVYSAALRSAFTHLAHGDTLDLRRGWLRGDPLRRAGLPHRGGAPLGGAPRSGPLRAPDQRTGKRVPCARNRVNRGGSFNNAASNALSANRNNNTPENQNNNLGLRPAKASPRPIAEELLLRAVASRCPDPLPVPRAGRSRPNPRQTCLQPTLVAFTRIGLGPLTRRRPPPFPLGCTHGTYCC